MKFTHLASDTRGVQRDTIVRHFWVQDRELKPLNPHGPDRKGFDMNASIRCCTFVVAILTLPLLGQTVSLEPRGGVGNEITVGPGATVTIDFFVENLAPELFRSYQMTLESTYTSAKSGTVDHDGLAPIVDDQRSDFVFSGVGAVNAGSVSPVSFLAAVIDLNDAVLVTDKKYLGEVTFVVSNDASGDFFITLVGVGLTSVLATPGQPPEPIAFTPIAATINVICLGNEDCDDGLFCNGAETCVGGLCIAGSDPCTTPSLDLCDEDNDLCVECLTNADCDDGVICNGVEECITGACQAGPDAAPGTACGDPSSSLCDGPDQCDGNGVCGNNTLADGTPCDDNMFCTTGELCTGGVCGGGGPTDCNDFVPCTTDSCNEDTDQCDNPLDAGFCFIDNICYPVGKLSPDNECETCNSAMNPNDWTMLDDGSPCDSDGNDCTENVCTTGICTHPDQPQGTPCDDGVACTGTGAPGVGVDECDAFGTCAGVLDPNCADDCVNAIVAFEGANFSNNTGFGPDDEEASCQPNSNNDAWFRYSPQGCIGDTGFTNGIFRFNTEGSSFTPSNDTVISIYDACGGGNELDCDDDSGTGLLSSLLFNVTSGTTYFIRVAGFLNNTGPIQLNITRENTCFIDGMCYADGTVNPANSCQICTAALSNIDWTSRPKGLACGSSSFD